MMSKNTAGNFTIETDHNQILAFYNRLRAHAQLPELIVKFNQRVNNLECLIAEDLADGLDGIVLPEHPEKRAFEFLCALSDLLGLDPLTFRKHLFVKHVNHSLLGVHCVLGLRKRNTEQPTSSTQRFIEMEDNSFVVHLDQKNRLYMLTATYQNEVDFIPTECEWDKTVKAALAHFAEQRTQSAQVPLEKIYRTVSYQGLVWVPDWKVNAYRLNFKVKVTTARQTFVLFIMPEDDEGNPTYIYHQIGSYDRPDAMKIARILNSADAAAPLRMLEKEQSVTPLIMRRVLLKDVEHDDRILEGPYAYIVDDLTTEWPTVSEPGIANQSSHLDRLMAYYHLDKIQRYFRALGLNTLNAYRSLNPVRATLATQRETGHFLAEEQIVFNQIEGLFGNSVKAWTDARNPRTIYHEYVHVVTDALARLQRQRKSDKPHWRLSEMLQAAAIDEGLADYFASSLAAQQGDTAAIYRILRYNANRLSFVWQTTPPSERTTFPAKWTTPDDRLCRPLQSGPMDLASINDPCYTLEPNEVYLWCQQWARYLWLLRLQLGVEVADMLIANSILFLTRWSSFSLGVLALIAADQQLFGGQNRATIIRTARLDTEDVAVFYPSEDPDSTPRSVPPPAGQPSGIQLQEVDTEDKATLLQSCNPETFNESMIFSYSLSATAEPATSQNLDLGQMWTQNDANQDPVPMEL